MKSKILVTTLSILIVILLIALIGLGGYTLGMMQGGRPNDPDDPDPIGTEPTETEPTKEQDDEPAKEQDDEPAKEQDEEPDEPEYEPYKAYNTPEEAVENTFLTLYGRNTPYGDIQNLAPDAYWNAHRDVDPSQLAERFNDAKYSSDSNENTQGSSNSGNSSNPYGDYGLSSGEAIVAPYTCKVEVGEARDCSSSVLATIQNELSTSYGISKSSVVAAVYVSANVKYGNGGSKTIIDTFVVVQIGDYWYVYDRGMFYADLVLDAVESSSGYNYLMSAAWLK